MENNYTLYEIETNCLKIILEIYNNDRDKNVYNIEDFLEILVDINEKRKIFIENNILPEDTFIYEIQKSFSDSLIFYKNNI